MYPPPHMTHMYPPPLCMRHSACDTHTHTNCAKLLQKWVCPVERDLQ